MIKEIDHIGIAVKSIDEALKFYTDILGIKPEKTETLPEQGVRATLIPLGDAEIELVEPIDPEGAVAKFIERRGEGLHHLGIEVEDIDKALESLAAKGVELIDKKGRRGLAGMVGFLHPRSAKGVLIELAQKV